MNTGTARPNVLAPAATKMRHREADVSEPAIAARPAISRNRKRWRLGGALALNRQFREIALYSGVPFSCRNVIHPWMHRTDIFGEHAMRAERTLFVRGSGRLAQPRAGLVFGALLVLAVMAVAQGGTTHQPDIILRMVMDAKTRADHEDIAAYYEKEAADNEAQANSHRELAEAYRRFHNSPKVQMALHCEPMADYYSKIAAQDSELAAEHQRLAQAGR